MGSLKHIFASAGATGVGCNYDDSLRTSLHQTLDFEISNFPPLGMKWLWCDIGAFLLVGALLSSRSSTRAICCKRTELCKSAKVLCSPFHHLHPPVEALSVAHLLAMWCVMRRFLSDTLWRCQTRVKAFTLLLLGVQCIVAKINNNNHRLLPPSCRQRCLRRRVWNVFNYNRIFAHHSTNRWFWPERKEQQWYPTENNMISDGVKANKKSNRG